MTGHSQFILLLFFFFFYKLSLQPQLLTLAQSPVEPLSSLFCVFRKAQSTPLPVFSPVSFLWSSLTSNLCLSSLPKVLLFSLHETPDSRGCSKLNSSGNPGWKALLTMLLTGKYISSGVKAALLRKQTKALTGLNLNFTDRINTNQTNTSFLFIFMLLTEQKCFKPKYCTSPKEHIVWYF